MKEVTIYTDGACSGNPGPGGYGVILQYGEKRKELSGGFQNTTNNRMEMMAAIEGLKALKSPCQVRLVSDSRYLVDGITKGWAKKWQANNWKKADKSRAKNIDLWSQILALLSVHTVQFEWVEGHAGHPENERCDEMAVSALKNSSLPVDEGYEP